MSKNLLDTVNTGLRVIEVGIRFVKNFDKLKKNFGDIIETTAKIFDRKPEGKPDPGIIVKEKDEEKKNEP